MTNSEKDPYGRLTTQAIIERSEETKHWGKNWKEVYANLHKALETPEWRILRNGDTLFLIHILNKGIAQVHVFNADAPEKYLENFIEFAKAMEKAGYRKVFGIAEDMEAVNALKQIGYPVQIADAGENRDGKKIYRATVELK